MLVPVIPDLTVAELAEASGISARKGKYGERSERWKVLHFFLFYLDAYLNLS
jgi:hypothetical protein